MDRRNAHAQSSSYVGLLYSQQGSVAREDFPYESFHSSVHLGESENPPFSSQNSVDTPVPTPVPTPVDRVVRRKWTPADDEVLISGWLNTSKDAIVGNDQKSQTFWQRVADYYAASPHGGEDGEKRTHHCVKKRWHRINDQVNKFCGAFSAADRQISSGESDTDVLKKAHDIFYSDHNFYSDHIFYSDH
ncbi:glutathione S-transferase T3-like [Raphanus sativus]|uniref:Glutathione S-transferase T3-like n=1 Tax=Raphanus sativus TaxID=3726 RepID=A0A6J0LK53_RAPSA|nr:glutathione S-transferase T3-like [Raphanus sativus]